MKPSQEQALADLGSPDELRPEALRGLSDLDLPSAAVAGDTWARLPADRRRQAMRLCGELADRHIELNFDWLARLGLSDPDPQVRRQAVANLWECEDPSLPDLLLGLLADDADLEVRVESASALGRFVYQAEVSDVPPRRRRALEHGLLAAADDPDRRLSLKALESLGHSSSPQVLPLIDRAYRQGDEDSRRSALRAMGRSGDGRWESIVVAELRDAAPELRLEAARAAGELELRRSVPELLELLEDVNLDVQRGAVWALGQIGGKRARRALERLAGRHDDEALADAAAEALELLVFLDDTRGLEAGLRLLDEGW